MKIKNKKLIKKIGYLPLINLPIAIIAPATFVSYANSYDDLKTQSLAKIEEINQKIKQTINQKLANELKTVYPTQQESEKIRYYDILILNFNIIETSLKNLINNYLEIINKDNYYIQEKKLINTLSIQEKEEIITNLLSEVEQKYILNPEWLNNSSNFPQYNIDYKVNDKQTNPSELEKINSIINNLNHSITHDQLSNDKIINNINKKIEEHIERDEIILQNAYNNKQIGNIQIKQSALDRNAFEVKKSDIFITDKNNLFTYEDTFTYENINDIYVANGKILFVSTIITYNNVKAKMFSSFNFKYSFKQTMENDVNNLINNINENQQIFLKEDSVNKKINEISNEDFYSPSVNVPFNFSVKKINDYNNSDTQVMLNYQVSVNYPKNFKFDFIDLNEDYFYQKESEYLFQKIKSSKLLDINLAKNLPVSITSKGKEITADDARFFSPLETIAQINGDPEGYSYKIKSINKVIDSDGSIADVEVEVSNGIDSKIYKTKLSGFKIENDPDRKIINSNSQLTESEKEQLYNEVSSSSLDLYRKLINSPDYDKLTNQDKLLFLAASALVSDQSSKKYFEKVLNQVENDQEFQQLDSEQKMLYLQEKYKKEIENLLKTNNDLFSKVFDKSIATQVESIIKNLEENKKIDSSLIEKNIDIINKNKELINEFLNKNIQNENFDTKELEKFDQMIEKTLDELKNISPENQEKLINALNDVDIKKVKNVAEKTILWTIVSIGFLITAIGLSATIYLFINNKRKIKEKLIMLLSLNSITISALIVAIYILIDLLK
ncbi:hypothetical protein [Mesomycoplasma lagogenitalium]|uniref:Uncharacterized protein n=1 Tax=Mesomycoplasma lagogenitalium TaxID=171286 RepID=A0ABY8LXN7_9BACT|nr:hypothetical protein [Mesomycoplasma lagogenitalium]WGI37031.1 hypothetical protein QEG99_01970 [Mesomycoplasma lagogenitalium]